MNEPASRRCVYPLARPTLSVVLMPCLTQNVHSFRESSAADRHPI